MTRICRIAAVPVSFQFLLRTQIKTSVDMGYEVFLITSPGSGLEELEKQTGAKIYPLPIARGISIWSDLKSLFFLYRFFRRMDFDIVHSMTAKAGLLTALAGFIAHVPIRIHTFTGQAWLTAPPPLRWILKFFDWLVDKMNSQCYVDSFSQRDLLIKHKIAKPHKLKVLGNGSIAGVDLQKFNPDKWRSRYLATRQELQIPQDAKVINFTGRMNLEKGIRELLEAFDLLRNGSQNEKELYLLMVGPLEEGRNATPVAIRQKLKEDKNIRFIGLTPHPEKYLAVSDLFCIPSYREGFGTIAIEAAAMQLAAVGSSVIGLVDAIVDGETGLLVPPKNSIALAEAIKKLLVDNQLRVQMGKAARQRAIHLFDEKRINSYMIEEYRCILKTRKPLNS